MNILSLFDGMSCGRIALERANIPVNNYFSSEIKECAIKVANINYPQDKNNRMGDIKNIKGSDLPKIDLVIAGSPCQDFSGANKKRLGLDGNKSTLFFEYMRLLKECKPKYFLLENVRMKKEYQDVISGYLGVQPIMLNSALVSAQNRKRLYWSNIPRITTPKDKDIFLEDIVDYGIVDRDKSYCIDANYWKGTDVENYITKSRRQLIFQLPHGVNKGGIRAKDGKAPCMTTGQWQYNNLLIETSPVAFTEQRTEEAKRIRREYKKKYGRDFSPRRGKELVARKDGKMNCLTATYSLKEHTLIDEKLYYRKLTPIECERLQTLRDNYTEGVSNTQRYKMIGNGWTVDIIAHILEEIK